MSIPPPARAAVGHSETVGGDLHGPRCRSASPATLGADALLNDLNGATSHAFVIASVCDRQDSAERAWHQTRLATQVAWHGEASSGHGGIAVVLSHIAGYSGPSAGSESAGGRDGPRR